MRAPLVPTLALLAALTLAGCSAAGASGLSSLGKRAVSPTAAATATAEPAPPPPATAAVPTATSAPTTAAAPTATSAPTTATSPTAAPQVATTPDSAVTAAIQAVIQKANDEQQQAFAKGDPSIMKDTATSDYYNELVQINQDMAAGGVSAIQLVKLELGSISLRDANTAEATTFETWRSTNTDGSTDQSRDRNVYTLVNELGTWKIQADDHPDANADLPTGPSAPAPSSRPTPGPSGSVPPGSRPGRAPSGTVPPTPRVAPSQLGVSHNWSGYAATGGKYTAVTGTWTVPEPGASGGFSSGATWVGIGGVNSRDLIQAGTEETTDGNGRVRFNAWIEMLPQSSHPVPLAVSPGDSVTVSIAQQADGQWLFTLKNSTTGQSYQTTRQYASSLSSAEWIEEAPSAGRGVLPLDNFGTVQFASGSAVKDGKSLTIAQVGAKPVTMVDANENAIATPSALTSDGQGFSVARSASSPTSPAPQPFLRRRGF